MLSSMDALCRCGSPLTGKKTYCSARCRQRASRERTGVVTLSTVIDASGAAAFKMVCDSSGLTISQGIHNLISAHLLAVAAELSGGPPVHEPSADERSTTTAPERAPR